MRKEIFITRPDMHRLEQMVENRHGPTTAGLADFERKLDQAVVVEPENIPRTVVTVNSRVRLCDLDRDSELLVSVVFPFDSNADQNRVSVLAPLGMALLGARVGERLRFDAPGGPRRVKVLGLEYQPEAASRDQELPAREPRDVASVA